MDTSRSGLLSSLRNLGGSGVALLRTRLELLSVEVREEQARLMSLLAYGAAAGVLLSFGIFFLAAYVTVLVWDSHRLLALGAFAGIFLAGGALAFLATRQIARSSSRLFAASLDELARDHQALTQDDRPQ
jgi:uncharacterized membrane protein YqjE